MAFCAAYRGKSFFCILTEPLQNGSYLYYNFAHSCSINNYANVCVSHLLQKAVCLSIEFCVMRC